MASMKKPFGIDVDKERNMIIAEVRQIKRGIKKELFDSDLFLGGK